MKVKNASKHNFDRFGIFANFSNIVRSELTRPSRKARYIVATVGIHKVGCIILMVNSGTRSRIGLTLAGRLVGYTDLFVTSTIDSKGVKGLPRWDTVRNGRTLEIGVTRFVGNVGKVAKTWATRFFVPLRTRHLTSTTRR